jgi:hypothetical protein
MTPIGDHLAPSLRVLQRAYSGGVPDEDYAPLLAAIADDMSARSLAKVVAELMGRDRFVVENDAAAATGGPQAADGGSTARKEDSGSGGLEFRGITSTA